MKRLAITLSVVVLVAACQSPAPRMATETTPARIERLFRETPLVDGHNDLMIHYHACRQGCPRGLDGYDLTADAKGQTDIARWRQGGVGAQLLNAGWIDDNAPTLAGTLKGFDFARALVAAHPGDLVMARSSEEIRAAHAKGRVAIVLSLEHPGRLGGDQATVRRLAAEGLRANILAYSAPTPLADGHAGPPMHGGLSPLGREMVDWMQDSGVLVDLSHASADTARDVLDIATAPVIFSHSNAAALCDVSRNVPDDVLRRLTANGGIVMVAFGAEFVSKPFADWMTSGDAHWDALMKQHGGDRARVGEIFGKWEHDNPTPSPGTIPDLADHIEHIRDVAGMDHVGIGADFDGIPATVKGLEDVSTYPRLFEELARRGWSDTDLKKLAGENFLRVLDGADARARRG